LLKILQICNKAPYPPNDGSSIAVWNMAQGLLANQVDLYLLAINTKKHFKPDQAVPEDFRRQSHYRSVYRNTNVTAAGAFLNLFTGQSYFVSRFRFGKFRRALIDLLKRETFDVVQLEGLFMGCYLPEIRRYSKARVVLRAHNIEHFIWKRHIRQERFYLRKLYLSLQNSRMRSFEESVFSKVDAIVPITLNDEKAIRAMGFSNRIHACIMGVNIEEYLPDPKGAVKPKSVFYFASMDWLPNQEAVLWFLRHCWPRVCEAEPAARLIIAGRGMPLSFFHITEPNVSIVENVENGKQFFRQHQVMIVPLWSGSGLRIKIIEGMAHGKAIVSTSIGAEGTGATDGENIMIADTAGQFAESVIRLLSDDALRSSIERAAVAYAAREFDNARLVKRLVEFYGSLLNG
jgi:glycosyltransferase involved in cell wall biosynthesis